MPTLRCDAGGADVPFAVSPGAAAVRVWARTVSETGRRGAWATVATVSPSAGGVRFVPDRTGRYELCVRALDADGLAVPPGPLTAGLTVVRDAALTPAAAQLPAGPTQGGPMQGGPTQGGPALGAPGYGSRFSAPPALGGPVGGSISGPGEPSVPPLAGYDPVPPATSAGVPAGDAGISLNRAPRDSFPGGPSPGDAADEPTVPSYLAPPPLPLGDDRIDATPLGESTRTGTPDGLSDPDPLRSRVLLGAARNAVAQGDFSEAIGRFEEYLAENPGDVVVRAELAGVLIRADRAEEAAAAFTLLLSADPQNVDALTGLADLLIGLGQYEAAREHLLTLLAVTDPGRVSAYGEPATEAAARRWRAAVKLARSYLLEGRPGDAAAAVDAHLSGGPPADRDARLEYARLLMELGRLAEARSLLIALRETDPADARPPADLLLANVRLLDAEGARAAAADLASRPVSDPALWLGLAEALYRDGALRESRNVLGQLLAAHPDHVRRRGADGPRAQPVVGTRPRPGAVGDVAADGVRTGAI